MKTIGIIGGMSWESTLLYYQIINREVATRLGKLHSAKILLESFNFQEIANLQAQGEWPVLARLLSDSARKLQIAGADCVLIATNTMHKIADEVQASIRIPLLHIGDATAAAIQSQGLDSVGLLGTRFTMEQDFYRERLERLDIHCLIPEQAQRDEMHRNIFEELCQGKCLPGSRLMVQQMIRSLAERGAQGVILGCTEIPLLIGADDACLPVFDTTRLHAMAAVDFIYTGYLPSMVFSARPSVDLAMAH
jgi:aspartate racemase